jgi:ubiquinone/menaquinone biosynthesis C-methylase UbiE
MTEIQRIINEYTKRINNNTIKSYSLFEDGELYSIQKRELYTLELLKRVNIRSLECKNILEVGCGRGDRLLDWVRWGAQMSNLYGVDIMDAFINVAKFKVPLANLSISSGDKLSFNDSSFDIIMQSIVFSSILEHGLKIELAREMTRVLKQGGIIIWYDIRYKNPYNEAIRPIATSEIKELFPGFKLIGGSATLLPLLSRKIAKYSISTCNILERIPFLRSHYLYILIRG